MTDRGGRFCRSRYGSHRLYFGFDRGRGVVKKQPKHTMCARTITSFKALHSGHGGIVFSLLDAIYGPDLHLWIRHRASGNVGDLRAVPRFADEDELGTEAHNEDMFLVHDEAADVTIGK